MADQRLFLGTADLPPKPDPISGEPRPPRAPGFLHQEKPTADSDKDRDRSVRRMPSPPEGEGRLLEWYRHSQRAAIMGGVGAYIFIVAGVTILQGFDPTWMTIWWMWLLIILPCLGVYGSFRTVDCAVGAEWLKVGKTWVRLYELTEITAKHRSQEIHLEFRDGTGRETMVKVNDIQKDRYMWDLIYNGILHSVIVGGAKTNSLLHSALNVPRPESPLS